MQRKYVGCCRNLSEYQTESSLERFILAYISEPHSHVAVCCTLRAQDLKPWKR